MNFLISTDPAFEEPGVLDALMQVGDPERYNARTPNLYLLHPYPHMDPEDVLEALNDLAEVVSAGSCDCEVILPPVIDATVDDLSLPSDQWALGDISDTPGTYSFDADGTGSRVYVVDVAVNPTLAAFGGRVSVIHNPFGGSGFHGTAVMDCAIGSEHGVAPGALGYSAAGFDVDGTGGSVQNLTDALIAAADHIEDNPISGVSVVNMSWGVTGGFLLSDPFVAIFDRLDALDAILICSAGNGDGTDGFNMDAFGTQVFPAENPKTLAVGAHDINRARTPWSNYPADIYAPGGAVKARNHLDERLTVSGTSFSSPFTSGAALCWASSGLSDPLLAIMAMRAAAIDGGVTNVPNDENDLRLFKPAVLGGNTPVDPVDPSPDLPAGMDVLFSHDAGETPFEVMSVSGALAYRKVRVYASDVITGSGDVVLSMMDADGAVALDRNWISEDPPGQVDGNNGHFLLVAKGNGSPSHVFAEIEGHDTLAFPLTISGSVGTATRGGAHFETAVATSLKASDVVSISTPDGTFISRGQFLIIGDNS